MSEVADGVRVVSMVRNQPIPLNLVIDVYDCKVSYYGQTKECEICEKIGYIAGNCPFRGRCLRCGGRAGHLYRDCRHEPAAATSGTPALPGAGNNCVMSHNTTSMNDNRDRSLFMWG